MFAIVKTGGKQYRVSPGDVVLVEKIEGEDGQAVTLDQVLMCGDDKGITLGASLEKVVVQATIRRQTRGEKILVFKKRRRQGYRRTKGHRQDLTLLNIGEISLDGKVKTAAAPKAEKVATIQEDAPKAKKAATPKADTATDAPTKKAAPKAKKTDAAE